MHPLKVLDEFESVTSTNGMQWVLLPGGLGGVGSTTGRWQYWGFFFFFSQMFYIIIEILFNIKIIVNISTI